MNAELKELLGKAFEQAEFLRAAGVAVRQQLSEGVTILKAYDIIDKYWPAREGAKMKLMLSSAFPSRNADMILCARFSRQLGEGLQFLISKEFFEQAIPQIAPLIEEKLKVLNQADLNDPIALAAFQAFRKEPARFVNYMEDGWFEGRGALLADNVKAWTELTQEARSVENGDYLFMEDYRGKLDDLLKFVLRYFEDGEEGLQNKTLDGVEYYADQILVRLKVCELFLEYLDMPVNPPATEGDPS